MTWDGTCSARVTWLLTWTFLIGLTTADYNSTISSKPRIVCEAPFQAVGSRCLFIDHLITGSWEDMREVCRIVGGHLLTLQDANVLSDIFQYLQENGQDAVSYWVGANDQQKEGSWVWSYDLSPVHMGSPLWGEFSYPSGVLQPTGGVVENCAILNEADDFYMHDAGCEESHSVICEDPLNKAEADGTAADNATAATAAAAAAVTAAALQLVFSKDNNNIKTNTSVSGCMFPFELIGGRCLFVETLGTGTWEERKTLCESLGTKMVKLDDANFLGAIFDYLQTNDITNVAFWVGASDEGEEGVWKWLDGSLTTRGTPFWGNFGMGAQEPAGGTSQNCAALNNLEHFLMHDYSCVSGNPSGVICEY